METMIETWIVSYPGFCGRVRRLFGSAAEAVLWAHQAGVYSRATIVKARTLDEAMGRE